MGLVAYSSKPDGIGIAEAGLGLRIINADLSMDPFGVSLDDRLKVLELGLQIDPFKIEEAEGNLLLFKPRLCIGSLIDSCFKLAGEERLTIVVDLMEALGDKDAPRVKLAKDFLGVNEECPRVTASVFQHHA